MTPTVVSVDQDGSDPDDDAPEPADLDDQDTEAVATTGPTLTLAEAARRCTASESTIRRRLRNGDLEGATRDATGSWAIPITALVTSGLMSPTTPPDTPTADPLTGAMAGPMASPGDSPDSLDEVERLRAELAAMTIRAEVAEAVADERDRMIESQAVMLRMLEAGAIPPPSPPRRWWNRKPKPAGPLED